MFMSANRRNLLRTLLTANAGSCGCGRPKLSDVYEPKPKSKIPAATQNPKLCSSDDHKKNDIVALSSAMENDELTSTSFSFNIDTITSSTTLNSESEPDLPISSKIMLSPCPKIIDSIAVVKVSNDPYQDFRHSMVQMIIEKEIYSKSDLQELLQCFLELNSPSHHDVIVRVFTEIWNQVISKEIIDVTVKEQEEEGCHAVAHGENYMGSYQRELAKQLVRVGKATM